MGKTRSINVKSALNFAFSYENLSLVRLAYLLLKHTTLSSFSCSWLMSVLHSTRFIIWFALFVFVCCTGGWTWCLVLHHWTTSLAFHSYSSFWDRDALSSLSLSSQSSGLSLPIAWITALHPHTRSALFSHNSAAHFSSPCRNKHTAMLDLWE